VVFNPSNAKIIRHEVVPRNKLLQLHGDGE
jgi:hypothetical protein